MLMFYARSIFFGYDSGYINGVTGSSVFIDVSPGGRTTVSFVDFLCTQLVENGQRDSLAAGNLTLITSILSAGTFFGAIIAGDVADRIGRRPTSKSAASSESQYTHVLL